MGRRDRSKPTRTPGWYLLWAISILIPVSLGVVLVMADPEDQNVIVGLALAGSIPAFILILLVTRFARSKRAGPTRPGSIPGSARFIINSKLPIDLPRTDLLVAYQPPIELDEEEYRAWRQTAVDLKLTLEERPRVRLQGMVRGHSIHGGINQGTEVETYVRVKLSLEFEGEFTLLVGPRGKLARRGVQPDLARKVAGAAGKGLLALRDVTLIVDAEAVHAWTPGVVTDRDRLCAMIELTVAAAEAIS